MRNIAGCERNVGFVLFAPMPPVEKGLAPRNTGGSDIENLGMRVGKLEPKLRIFTVRKWSVPEPRTVVDTIFTADELKLKLRTVTVYPYHPADDPWR
jgi:hypothetical protein